MRTDLKMNNLEHEKQSKMKIDSEIVLSCQNLSKTYAQGHLKVDVLKGIDFSIRAGETVAIIGASGSGKSTLLNLLGGLDLPSAGNVQLDQQDIFLLGDDKRGLLRNKNVGFVYQFHHLLAEFTALENVAMPLLIGGEKKRLAYQKAQSMLEKVGLGERLEHKPSELSGGERQRVAIARALVTHPKVVLMDEPTGNLDRHAANAIHELMMSLNEELKISFIIVTHDEHLASKLQRVLTLNDGVLSDASVAVA
ncbi:lipoprotein-releasing ABC transporter ATP-binding protein LolD [Aurantivibrio infirmus]